VILQLLLPILISVAVPLAFLYMVRELDLYASGSFTTVVACFLSGLLAFFGAYVANMTALRWIEMILLTTLVAPIIEEVLKSLVLVYYVRRPDFTYFVDGAIYGFAAGTAFAIFENIFYLTQYGAGAGLGLSLSRAFSTSLMHGSASALVGVSLGRLRFGRGMARIASLIIGWGVAMAVHMSFNRLVASSLTTETLILAILIGLGGVGVNAGLILWGLREERGWLRETLGLGVGVSAREAAVVQQLADLDTLLKPITERFGPEKRQQVEEFLRLQALLGLKRKAQELTPDAQLREELAAQVAEMRQEMDKIRRSVGLYCMSYVRSILPPETEPLWDRLGQVVAQERQATMNLWGNLGTRMESKLGDKLASQFAASGDTAIPESQPPDQ